MKIMFLEYLSSLENHIAWNNNRHFSTIQNEAVAPIFNLQASETKTSI